MGWMPVCLFVFFVCFFFVCLRGFLCVYINLLSPLCVFFARLGVKFSYELCVCTSHKSMCDNMLAHVHMNTT